LLAGRSSRASRAGLTQRRDLRSGVSYWQSRRAPRLAYGPLKRDVKTDIVVVGAGITGAVIAESLSQKHRVVVVERRGPARGSTLASTALIAYEIDQPLTKLSRIIGADDAIRAWRRSHLAMTAVAERTRALAIACDARRADSLYLSGSELDAAALREEAAARSAAGLETLFLPRSELKSRFGISRAAGLFSYSNLTADPRRMALGYLQVARGRSTRIYSPVDVTGIEVTATEIAVITRDGPAIRASHVVLATGYELPLFPIPGDHRTISTFAIATRPQARKPWPEDVLIWEASDPYLYARTTADGRVLCGGEDEDFPNETERDAMIDSKAKRIAAKLRRIFPRLDTEPAFAWTGTFGTTETGLPLIGRIASAPNCWFVLGFGGNGMTYSRIAADIISAEFDGRRDPDADLYAPGRPLATEQRAAASRV
jgi:glycine/D-amino acid oxidase-like deaminating enzyme